MPELTDRQTGWLNDELGTAVTRDQLQEVFDRVGSVRDTAIVFVRRRINDLINQPLTVGISSVANFGFEGNLKALERQLARLQVMDDDPSDDPVTVPEAGDELPTMQVRTLGRRRRR